MLHSFTSTCKTDKVLGKKSFREPDYNGNPGESCLKKKQRTSNPKQAKYLKQLRFFKQAENQGKPKNARKTRDNNDNKTKTVEQNDMNQGSDQILWHILLLIAHAPTPTDTFDSSSPRRREKDPLRLKL